MGYRLSLKNITAAAERAFAQTVGQFEDAARDRFAEPIYDWPGSTLRKNKQVVGSPRDVVDTGALQNSQQPADINGLRAEIIWDSDHASTAFLGKANYPARNVPLDAAMAMNMPAVFMAALQRQLG
jgi:hypothetical protein